MDEPEIPGGLAVFGGDDAAGTHFMLTFDERGVSRKYDVTMSAGEMTWARDEAGFAQRNVITIAADGAGMTGSGAKRRRPVIMGSVQMACGRSEAAPCLGRSPRSLIEPDWAEDA
ncbi:hypothetical protein [Dactylosporangium sp. CA-233914]|uniref:hypothetical protein n=1 Tax=Dactylosporangium sp. CA-233914 TaxID=3239934 RepID=UPI003D8A0876